MKRICATLVPAAIAVAAALDSVARLPEPVGLSLAAQQMLRNDGMIEAWLFQNDGRFADTGQAATRRLNPLSLAPAQAAAA